MAANPELRLNPETTLPVTLATFFLLVRSGIGPLADASVEAACAAFAEPGADPDALGEALVAAVRPHVAGERIEDVVAAIAAIAGKERVRSDLGEPADRDARAVAVRRAHFGNHLPWLAQIAEREPTGEIVRRWVLVESFDAAARVMDPNPWDDREEQRDIPISDFMVVWELCGCPSARVV